MITASTITCPKCGYQATEQMPTDACQFFYDCRGCGERLKPEAGDCCVFCSYGTMPSGCRHAHAASAVASVAVRWLRRADLGTEEIACCTAQNLYSLHSVPVS
jgi:hypothetical protein